MSRTAYLILVIKTNYFYKAGNDKTKRTKIHQMIRQSYSNCESETIDQDGEKKIKIFKTNKNSKLPSTSSTSALHVLLNRGQLFLNC